MVGFFFFFFFIFKWKFGPVEASEVFSWVVPLFFAGFSYLFFFFFYYLPSGLYALFILFVLKVRNVIKTVWFYGLNNIFLVSYFNLSHAFYYTNIEAGYL